MADLFLSGQPVRTVFDLLGRSENDMTYALGWGLSRSDVLLRAFLMRLDIDHGGEITVRLQQHGSTGGFTDIEVSDGSSFHVIVEAKRGWWLPSPGQLELYARRFDDAATGIRRLVVLTQWGAESAARHEIAKMALPERCDVIGWSDVLAILRSARRAENQAGKRRFDELGRYLREVTDMRDIDSNRVYVVALNYGTFEGAWDLNLVDVVAKHGRYFFPASGKNWPKEPPNYMAYRYDGRLQSIHHVDGYVIETDMSKHLPVPSTDWPPHYVLALGPAIRPAGVVPTGPRIRRAARVWCDIDLLLTAPTISDALTMTQQRRNARG